jgi:hypothetical protein
MKMAMWSTDELQRIEEADDMHISPFRDDGVTYGTPTWIWSVAVDGLPLLTQLVVLSACGQETQSTCPPAACLPEEQSPIRPVQTVNE